jgi:hypothetical protein
MCSTSASHATMKVPPYGQGRTLFVIAMHELISSFPTPSAKRQSREAQ